MNQDFPINILLGSNGKLPFEVGITFGKIALTDKFFAANKNCAGVPLEPCPFDQHQMEILASCLRDLSNNRHIVHYYFDDNGDNTHPSKVTLSPAFDHCKPLTVRKEQLPFGQKIYTLEALDDHSVQSATFAGILGRLNRRLERSSPPMPNYLLICKT